MGGYWKVSFHPPALSHDGHDSQFGPTKNYLEKLDSLGLSRPSFMRWTRTSAVDEKSYVCAVRIIFPTDHLKGHVTIKDDNQNCLLEMAPSKKAVEVLVVFSKVPLTVHNGRLIYSAYVEGFGEYVNLVSRKTAFDGASLPADGTYNGRLLDGAPSHIQDPGPVNGLIFSTGMSRGKPQLVLTELTGLVLNLPNENCQSRQSAGI